MATEPMAVMPDMVEMETETTEELEKKAGEAEEPKESKPAEEEVEIEVEEEAEKSADKGPDLKAENERLQQQLLDVGNDIRSLKAQMEDREEEPKKGKKQAAVPEGDEISDEQLLAVMEEHKDNPGVLLRVYKHLAENAATKVATGIRDETMRNVEYQQWHRELRTHNDGVMGPVYQGNPQLKSVVSDTTKRLGLDKHPMGEVLAFSLIQYAKGQEKETGKAGEKEAKRVEEIDKVKGLDKTRREGDKGSKGKISLSAEQRAVADKLGVAHDVYAKFLPKE